MGRDAAKDECREMNWSKCPNHGNKAAMERVKVSETKFRVWKERSGAKRDKKKKSAKARVDKRIQAVATKTLREQANGATAADQRQAGTSSPRSAKPPSAASQATAAATGAAAGNQPPLLAVSFAAGLLIQSA